MKLILEKWKAYTQSCVDSDDDKGVAVVKKVGSDEVESCHASKDKAEDAVKARYANYKKEPNDDDDVIEEISTMSGGDVQGYAGSAVGDVKTVKKFNKDEKEISKLKGVRLAEKFSTSTQTGGVPQSKVSAEDERKGHVERSRRQGLKNVMEVDDTTKAAGDSQSNEKTPEPKDKPTQVLEENGYIFKKKLGEGKFGIVVLAQGDGEKKNKLNYAIKILKKPESEDAKREIRNYKEISGARSKDNLIADHFPEVEEIFNDQGLTFIVMEVLEPLHSEIRGMFTGLEKGIRYDYGQWAAEKPVSMYDASKDLTKRMETILTDEDQLSKVLNRIRATTKMGLEDIDKVTTEFSQELDMEINIRTIKSWARANEQTANSYIKKAEKYIVDKLGEAKDAYVVTMDDLQGSHYSRFFIAFIVTKVCKLILKHTNFKDAGKVLFVILSDIQELYRYKPYMKAGYSDKEIGTKGRGGSHKQVKKIFSAIEKVYEETGLLARDLHDMNFMRRPGGDVVIVDLGAFKTKPELDKLLAKRKRLRENRIKIKIKR